MRKLVAICLGAAWFTGCALAAPVGTAGAPATSEMTGDAKPAIGAADAAIGELALKVASEHLSLEPGGLEIVRIEAVRWPDSSIGCPQPGFEYLQVVTPGHLAHVRDRRGVVHRVHMADGHGIVCEKRADKAAGQDARLPTFSRQQLEALARADLATRLGVATNDVAMLRSRAVEWPDESLGCTSAGEATAAGPSKGFVIYLAYWDREFTYHSDLRRVIPCPPIETR